jgi:HD-like signal output (HDOD) protein/CheY-like chemotaxis protein
MKNLLFVDDEPKVLQGLQRQLRPLRHEWEMNFIESGPQALTFMAAHPVDIVVSDMMMPLMDGSQLLSEIARRHPRTVRIILSGHAEREAVLRLVGPAHQYLSKPCDAEELRGAITRAFALRDLLGNERLKQLTTRIKHLPTLPALHNQLTDELRKDAPSMERIGEIISRDIGMAAKILQLVNSAFFGLARPINDTTEAVVYLGVTTVRSLALSVEIFSQYHPEACRSFSLDALAQHSWMTGALARRIGHLEKMEPKILEQCFLAGLLHDIGQLILACGLPEEYAEVIRRARDENRQVWQVEQEIFGATHADVGAYLLALWGLPNPIIEAVAMHHHPGQCLLPGFSPAIAVHVADVFMHEYHDIKTEIPAPQLDVIHLEKIGLTSRIDAWRAGCLEQIKT